MKNITLIIKRLAAKFLEQIRKRRLIKILTSEKNCTIETADIPLSVLKNKIGQNCYINKEVIIYKDDVEIGDFSYINGGKIFYAKIGKYCSIGYGVCIGGGEHDVNKVSTFPLKHKVARVPGLIDYPKQQCSVIGNDVWIGNNAIIKQGVYIGDGAIIASGAVVTKNVEPYSIVGGVPAKLIRNRFDSDTVDILLSVKWWDWDICRLRKAVENNEFDNIESFVEKYNESKNYGQTN